MTVASNNYLPLLYPGDGVTVAFDFTWLIFEDTDLVVKLYSAGVLTPLVKDVDYTVDAESTNTPTGGGITLMVAPALGETLIVSRAVPNNQQLSLGNSGPFLPQDLEKEFDRVILLTQQLAFLIAASVKLPANILPANFDPILPAGMAGLAGQLLAINGDANGLALVTPPSGNPAALTIVSILVAADYNVAPGVDVVLDKTAGAVSYFVNLPAANAFLGRVVRVKIANAGGHGITVAVVGGGLIDDQVHYNLVAGWQSKAFISDGVNWFSF